jgi:hypothetical protein
MGRRCSKKTIRIINKLKFGLRFKNCLNLKYLVILLKFGEIYVRRRNINNYSIN